MRALFVVLAVLSYNSAVQVVFEIQVPSVNLTLDALNNHIGSLPHASALGLQAVVQEGVSPSECAAGAFSVGGVCHTCNCGLRRTDLPDGSAVFEVGSVV